MSHIVMANNDKSKIVSIAALKRACEIIGKLELVEGEPGHTSYRTWYTDRSYSRRTETPIKNMPGVIGANADYVIRATTEALSALKNAGYPNPYEIGVVWIPEENCYRLVYDAYMGGAGLDRIVGEPITGSENDEVNCPLLIQNYNVARDLLTAENNGDALTVITQPDGSIFVGSKADMLTLPSGEGIRLNKGDVVAEVRTGARL